MFNFFNKKNAITDINWLGVDMHSHILPGIDDGSPDLETSVSLVQGLSDLGFEKLIASPHIFKELYPNTPFTINEAKVALQNALKNHDTKIIIGAGAEYMINEDFNIDEELCLLNENHLLIEMSYLAENPTIHQHIFDVQIKNLQPVLAHPERYIYYHKDLTVLKTFKDKGCLLQLNLLSVMGYYGKPVQQAAEVLLKENMYDFAGTDLHHDKHLSALTTAVQSGILHKMIGNYPFKNKEVFGF